LGNVFEVDILQERPEFPVSFQRWHITYFKVVMSSC